METRRLSIPIYLNQRIVFDLLAISEGGFSQVQRVNTSETVSQEKRVETAGDVGLANAFAFLSFGFQGGISKQQDSASQRDISEERVFTPTSLFSRLRDVLIERNLLLDLDGDCTLEDIRAGLFVEFSGVLRKNPMVAYIEAAVKILETVKMFEETAKGKSSQRKYEIPGLQQMRKLKEILTQSGSLDLVADVSNPPGLRAVVPVQLEYFATDSPAAIIDGQFVVIGKVTRVVDHDDETGINLLRGTSMEYLPLQIIRQMEESSKQASEDLAGLGHFDTKVPGPSMLVIPIAIFI